MVALITSHPNLPPHRGKGHKSWLWLILSYVGAKLGPEAEGALWHAYSQTAKTLKEICA
jgi:hypothetical protein